MLKNIIKYSTILILCSCDSIDIETTTGSAKKQAKEISANVYQNTEELAEKITSKINETIKNPQDTIPAKELAKLREFEYKVIEVDKSSSVSKIEEELNLLGKKYWDCEPLASNQGDTKFKIFCKKKPFTALRYVPKVF